MSALQSLFEAAIADHRAGRLQGAIKKYRQILSASAKHPPTLNLLGVALMQAGSLDEGFRHLKSAQKLAPNDPEIAYNLATAELTGGRESKALSGLDTVLRIAPTHPGALLNRGLLYERRGKLDNAIADFQSLLRSQPNHPAASSALAGIFIAQNRAVEALSLTEAAVAQFPGDPEAANAKALALSALGRHEEAIADLHTLLEKVPTFHEARRNLASCLSDIKEFDAAEQQLNTLIREAPTESRSSIMLANLLMQRDRTDEAIAVLSNALSADEKDTDVIHQRALINEMTNRTELARRDADTGLKIDPRHPGLKLVSAKLDRRDGKFDSALSHLKSLDLASIRDQHQVSSIMFERAGLLDQLGRYEEAFKAFVTANDSVTRQEAGRHDPGQELARLDRIAQVTQSLSAEDPIYKAGYAAEATKNSPPVFLVGYPRSGTTLLDRVLDAHPGISVMEEIPIVARLTETMRDRGLSYPHDFPSIGPDLLQELRKQYWDEVREAIGSDPDKTVLVDKLPLSLVHAGFIKGLFPDAVFILALRHPADCVLSCFMQNFRINQAMAAYLTLEDAAQHYDRTMAIFQSYRDVLGIVPEEVRYEDLIEDLESVARRVLDRIGVPWDSEVLNFAQHLQGKRIDTPSYAQVAAPVHKGAAGRWMRYQDQLEPIMPTLEPWIEHYGYSAG